MHFSLEVTKGLTKFNNNLSKTCCRCTNVFRAPFRCVWRYVMLTSRMKSVIRGQMNPYFVVIGLISMCHELIIRTAFIFAARWTLPWYIYSYKHSRLGSRFRYRSEVRFRVFGPHLLTKGCSEYVCALQWRIIASHKYNVHLCSSLDVALIRLSVRTEPIRLEISSSNEAPIEWFLASSRNEIVLQICLPSAVATCH